MSKAMQFFKKHKNKAIAALVIVAALSTAWVVGGIFPDLSDSVLKAPQPTVSAPSAEVSCPSAEPSGNVIIQSLETPDATEGGMASSSPDDITAPSDSETPTISALELDPDTDKDHYLTDPVPEGKSLPAEPEDTVHGDGSFSVTLSVRCDTILDNMSLLNKEKYELIPEDGVIFPATTITVYEGESVLNVLQRAMKQYKIHMTHRHTPIYNSAYIEAIHNLYEFDVGELSGWMYCVNDWYPNYGCSRYQLKPDDVIKWHYTCDLGRDLGQYWVTEGQAYEE